jgi:hypothetical protein
LTSLIMLSGFLYADMKYAILSMNSTTSYLKIYWSYK